MTFRELRHATDETDRATKTRRKRKYATIMRGCARLLHYVREARLIESSAVRGVAGTACSAVPIHAWELPPVPPP
ncbi:hypothetical protein GCM10010449_60740 [Streptomyces rectiviolaceus]|uniref:Integrase n=1 Tax=Streptomyces rectiviolaceus TaxID=332591 RepID=A0ABP6MZI7_9ACTN